MGAFGSQQEFQQDATRRTALTAELWKQAFGEIGARIRGLEESTSAVDQTVATLTAVGLARINELVLPQIAIADALRAAAEAGLDEVLPTIQAKYDEADAELSDLIGQAQAVLATLQTGAMSADIVAESGTRVFVTPAQKTKLDDLPLAADFPDGTFDLPDAALSADVVAMLAAANDAAIRAAIGAISLADVPAGSDMTAAEVLAALLTVDTDSAGINATTIKSTTPSANALSLLAAADYSAMRTLLGIGSAGLLTKGAASALRAYTTDAVITGDNASAAAAPVAVTYAASVALDWTSGINFEITATGNLSLANPTNTVSGTTRTLVVTASGGTRTVTLAGANFDVVSIPTSIPSGTALLLTFYRRSNGKIATSAIALS